MAEAFISVVDLNNGTEVQQVKFDNLTDAEIQLINTPGQVAAADAKYEYRLYKIDLYDNKHIRSVYTLIHHGRQQKF